MATISTTERIASGRYVNLGTAVEAPVAQTVLAYVKRTGDAGFGYLYGRVASGSINGHRLYCAGSALGFGASTVSQTSQPYTTTISGVSPLNAWAHLAASWSGDAATSSIKFFKGVGAEISEDSSRDISAAGTGAGSSAAAHPLYLFNRAGFDRHFIGDVAYVALWNRQLSLTELRKAQSDGPLSVPDGLILCWANGEDLGPYGYEPVARSSFVAGEMPPNTNLGEAGGDTTAPTLTSPAASATGATTASGSVSTDEANGTLYYLASASASESVATVKAGASQAVAAAGSQTVTVSGLAAATSYYLHFVHRDVAGNDSAVSTSAQFTTSAAGDTTPPTLTGPTATATGTSTASGTVSTNEGAGTLYWLASVSASESAASVKSGSSQAVTAVGTQGVAVTGLAASTGYYLHFLHRDPAGNDSPVVTSAQFMTDAASVVLKGIAIPLYAGSTPRANITGITALWWDLTAPDGTPDIYTTTASTDASGVLTLNIDAATALDVGDYGYLLLHKDGTLGNQYRDALEFAGAVQITDIS